MPRATSPVSPIEYSRVQDGDLSQTTEFQDGHAAQKKHQAHAITVVEENGESMANGKDSRTRYIWWLETACAILIVGALVGIIATVNAYDNKPLPHWPYQLSINSFIAAYSVILKTASGLIIAEGISHIKWTSLKRPRSLRSFWVHDEASRGPWGAVHLLWNDKGRHISSLGALIAILILFLEPFSQQIVTFPICVQVHDRNNATIPRTNYFQEEGTFTRGATNNIPWNLRNAINEGMFATNKLQLNVSCGTGNCTFPSRYSSLAFCSKCEDVSHKLIRVPWPNPRNITPVPEFARYPNITLPGSGSSGNLTLQIVAAAGSVEENRRVLVGQGSPTIDVIRALDPETYLGYSCQIAPCVRSYSGDISIGKFQEKQESEYMLPRNLMYGFYRAADLECVNDSKKQQLSQMGYDLEANPRWLPYNVSVRYNETLGKVTFRGTCQFMPEDKFDEFCDKSKPGAGSEGFLLTDEAAQIVPAECVYAMTDMAGSGLIANRFADLFKGEIQEHYSFSLPALFSISEPLMAIWHAGSGNGTLEDMSGFMKNISDSLTIHVRQHGHPNLSQPVLGETHSNTVCIRVQWEWIIYSAVVVGSTLMFFIWVVIQSKIDQAQLRKAWEKEGVHAPFYDFKSSALTLLFHGLDDGSRRELVDVGSTNQTSEMEKRVKNVDIQLIATERGWKLSTVGHHE